MDRKPVTLSGGEKQRVALGRCLVRDPQVFLLDEPLTNLDAKIRAAMRVEIKNIQKEIGGTMVIATPDEIEALAMADKIAVFNLGNIHQYDETPTVYDKPNDTFVAGFVGRPPMNMIDCSLNEKNGKFALDCGIFTVDVSKDMGSLIKEKATGSELILGIRAEHLDVSRQEIKNGIETEMYASEPFGTDTIVELLIGDNIFRTWVPIEVVYNFGEKLWMSFDRNNLYVFDKKTEKAIYS
jgi:ABC-type sugar transport system ATPase subunit